MNKRVLFTLNKVIKSLILMLFILVVVSTSNEEVAKSSNRNYNLSLDLTAMARKVDEDIKNDLYSSKDSFTGYLTGYGADCPLCSGHLSCMPSLDVLNGNVNYNDTSYGNVRIVASSSNLSCGTVIKFKASNISNDDIVAIVLDRGVGGNAIDLLSLNEDYARNNVGRQIITYDVIRYGW